jgi:hypothetical protein
MEDDVSTVPEMLTPYLSPSIYFLHFGFPNMVELILHLTILR